MNIGFGKLKYLQILWLNCALITLLVHILTQYRSQNHVSRNINEFTSLHLFNSSYFFFQTVIIFQNSIKICFPNHTYKKRKYFFTKITIQVISKKKSFYNNNKKRNNWTGCGENFPILTESTTKVNGIENKLDTFNESSPARVHHTDCVFHVRLQYKQSVSSWVCFNTIRFFLFMNVIFLFYWFD